MSLVYRLPPQQQLTMFRLFPMIGYYMIGSKRKGFLMFAALYPVMVAVSSVVDTLRIDLQWNAGLATIIGLIMYLSWNYFVTWDVNRLARRMSN